jgi:hypothetical protein
LRAETHQWASLRSTHPTTNPSHMMMMDKNNLEVAALIQKWLGEKGLVR